MKINIYKKNEAEFQALHKFLSYGVSLSGIWKYEREIQKVEKYPLWKSICVHFNFRVNPVVMILPLAGRTLLMAECKKVPTVGRNKELTLSEQLAMPTHHAGSLKSTLHEYNCSSCLTLYLYLY